MKEMDPIYGSNIVMYNPFNRTWHSLTLVKSSQHHRVSAQCCCQPTPRKEQYKVLPQTWTIDQSTGCNPRLPLLHHKPTIGNETGDELL